jgi:hypothetical protein
MERTRRFDVGGEGRVVSCLCSSHPFDNGTQPQSKRLRSADEWPICRSPSYPIDPNPADRQLGGADTNSPLVEISPSDAVRRRIETWHGISAEFVQVTSETRIAYHFLAPVHVLVVYEHGTPRCGESPTHPTVAHGRWSARRREPPEGR